MDVFVSAVFGPILPEVLPPRLHDTPRYPPCPPLLFSVTWTLAPAPDSMASCSVFTLDVVQIPDCVWRRWGDPHSSVLLNQQP